MKWLRGYIVVMLFVVGLYVLAEYSRVPELNWRRTLSSHDKIPFGTWVLYHELGGLFDEKPEESREELYVRLNEREDSNALLIMVEPRFEPGKSAVNELMRYVALGNTVFIATDELDKALADTLKLNLSSDILAPLGKDSTSLRLVNPQLDSTVRYTMLRNTVDGYFESFDTVHSVVLGMRSDSMANFIKVPVGQGMIYLHTAPMMFTNYSILEAGNKSYVENVLAYLPMDATQVIWDEYYKLGKGTADTPLRVMLADPNLRWAWYTALLTLLVFLAFAAKRRQRIIPVVVPPVNASLDFVDTIANVYFKGKDHRGIAHKRMSYWLDSVRQRYGMNTGKTDAEFARVLAAKSGVDAELTKDLADWCAAIRDGAGIGEKELLTFSGLIDQFQKSSIS
jgi:hypothetical protein